MKKEQIDIEIKTKEQNTKFAQLFFRNDVTKVPKKSFNEDEDEAVRPLSANEDNPDSDNNEDQLPTKMKSKHKKHHTGEHHLLKRSDDRKQYRRLKRAKS